MKYYVGTQADDSISERERKHRRLAYEAACEGIVLLENDGTLPLKKGNIALYGAGAINTVKGGSGSGEVNERYAVNIYEGLINAGFHVTSEKWLKDYNDELKKNRETYETECDKLADKAKDLTSLMDVMNYPFIYPMGRKINQEDVITSNTDTAIYVVARQAGENGDKKLNNGDFNLFDDEIDQLRFIAKNYQKTILIINSGAQMDLSFLDEIHVSSVIYYCQQGEEGGNALADILCGKINPNGKLSDTWVRKYEDIPFGNQYSYLGNDGINEYYHEGIYVGYRYADTFKVKPRYPFGYGLTYTSFVSQVQEITVDRSNISLKVNVRNTGDYAGKEIIQVYISTPSLKLDREYQSLIAFGKTSLLKPDNAQDLQINFDLEDCAGFDEEASAYILEKGNYIIRVGNSSLSKAVAVLRLSETVEVHKVKHVCKKQEEFVELHSKHIEHDTKDLPVYQIAAEDIKTRQSSYDFENPENRDDVKEILKGLKEKQLLKICLGAGIIGMFDGTGIVTPGAVGRTTGDFLKKGLVNVNLADGPAGLRIMKRTLIKKGRVRMADYLMGFMKYLPAFFKRLTMFDPEKEKPSYQFATAFPVATALAQSWNADLLEKVGKAVSLEMDEFNVTYWLGPAINIHRNPLCGRNFEY